MLGTVARKVQPVRILLVDDSPADVRLTREALRDSKLHLDITDVSDGIEALAYLRREGKYADQPHPDMGAERPHPDLILLDLNMPRMGGAEVLQQIKADPTLRDIPVVVLTTSDADADIRQVYALQANCYVTKPVDLEQFVKVVRSIEQFWFTVATLPVA